ncbi:hypothetical protein cypCar_00008179 [Cyprinus carpio]|nr:hypothetical protein cypCar_00008179 [Cyprinus carpio]
MALMDSSSGQVEYPPQLEQIRERLAENLHELWLTDKIEQGWTYGPDVMYKRSTQLVPFCLLDEKIKQVWIYCGTAGAGTTLIKVHERAPDIYHGKELATYRYYQVEPGTKLFPALFAKATSSNVFQFELGCIKVIDLYCCPQNVMPLSAGVFRSERRNAKPQVPPRLCVQHLTTVRCTRVPDHAQPVEVAHLEERYGWRAYYTQIQQIMTLCTVYLRRSGQRSHWRCPCLFLTCMSSDTLDDEDDDVIHMGHAIMTFYSAFIDLLGRCTPEMHVSVSGNLLGKLDKSLVMCLKD